MATSLAPPLAPALGHAAIQQGHRVLYREAHVLDGAGIRSWHRSRQLDGVLHGIIGSAGG